MAASRDIYIYRIVGALFGRNVLLALCRKALRAQAQALAEQPFSREAYARDPKQARAYFCPLLSGCGAVYQCLNNASIEPETCGAQMRKRCSFRLDMLVRAAAGGAAPAAANGSAVGVADPNPRPGPAAAAGVAAGALGPGAPGADVVMNGTLASGNCGLSLRLDAATTHIQAYFAKAVNYTLMITALSFVQVRRCRARACMRPAPRPAAVAPAGASRVHACCQQPDACTCFCVDAVAGRRRGVCWCQRVSFAPVRRAGGAADPADGGHGHAGRGGQGVAADGGPAGHHGRLPLPAAPDHRRAQTLTGNPERPVQCPRWADRAAAPCLC